MTKEKILYHWKPTEEDKKLGSKYSWNDMDYFDEYKIVEDESHPLGIRVLEKKEGSSYWEKAFHKIYPLIKNMLYGMDDFWLESNCGKEVSDNRAFFEQRDILKKKEESKKIE